MVGYSRQYNNDPTLGAWARANQHEASVLHGLNVFDLLGLDPRQHYDQDVLKARIRKLRLLLHPDKLNNNERLKRHLCDHPHISLNSMDAVRSFLYLADGGLNVRRWMNIQTNAIGWRSSWNPMAEDAQDMIRPIASFLANPVPSRGITPFVERSAPPELCPISLDDDITELTQGEYSANIRATGNFRPSRATGYTTGYLRDLGGRPDTVAIGFIRSPHHRERHEYVVIASISMQPNGRSRLMFCIRGINIHGEDIETNWNPDAPKSSAISDNDVGRLATFVGRLATFVGRFGQPYRYSMAEIRTFLEYTRHYRGLAPAEETSPTQRGTIWAPPPDAVQMTLWGRVLPLPTFTDAPRQHMAQAESSHRGESSRRVAPPTTPRRSGEPSTPRAQTRLADPEPSQPRLSPFIDLTHIDDDASPRPARSHREGAPAPATPQTQRVVDLTGGLTLRDSSDEAAALSSAYTHRIRSPRFAQFPVDEDRRSASPKEGKGSNKGKGPKK